MFRAISRLEVYTLYFFEYLKYGEFSSLVNAFFFMFTKKSIAKGTTMKTGMGLFKTRAKSLDFQYVNYAYELNIKRFIEKESFETFLDIGACLGEYAIWLGKKGKRCIAFEPTNESFEMITKNITLNGLQDTVIACNYGLGLKHSTAYFELNETNPGSNKKVEQPGPNTKKFEINSLDDKYQSLGLKPSDRLLIKIDVEGMELDMLNGARNFLKSFDNIVLIIEEKFSGECNIRKGLSDIANFEYGKIDDYNIYARKISNLES